MLKYIFKCTTGSFSRTIGRILAYIAIAAAILFLGSFLNIGNVNAQVNLDNRNLSYNNFVILQPGNRTLKFNQDKVYSDISSFPENYLITLCSDNNQITNWYVNNNSLTSVNVYTTNYTCTFPNSSYSGGHVVYVYGEINSGNACSVNGTSCIINTSLTMYVPNESSWAILNEAYSLEPINIDYSSGSIISNDKQLIDQNNTIINQNSQIINGQNNIYDKQVETNNFLKDDTPPDADISSLGNVQGLLPPGPLDSLLNIPFNFLSIVVSSLSGTCVPLQSTFVFDTTLTYPCFNDFYDNVPPGIMIFVNIIPSAFILILYFKHLYKKVDRAMSLESNSDDEWGVL